MTYLEILHKVKEIAKAVWEVLEKHHTAAACIVTALLLSFSFLNPFTTPSVEKEAMRLEKKIRQHYLDGKAIYEMFGYIPKDKI